MPRTFKYYMHDGQVRDTCVEVCNGFNERQARAVVTVWQQKQTLAEQANSFISANRYVWNGNNWVEPPERTYRDVMEEVHAKCAEIEDLFSGVRDITPMDMLSRTGEAEDESHELTYTVGKLIEHNDLLEKNPHVEDDGDDL